MQLENLTLDALEALLRDGPPELTKSLMKHVQPQFKVWAPQPGKQSDAYFCVADELLYGGAAGGGKSDLLLGLATTAHQRSVIFRQQSVDLQALWDRLTTIVKTPDKTNATIKLMKVGGRLIEMGHLDAPGSEQGWQGRAHDLIGFEEAAQLNELKVNFVSQWLRSDDPKQRCRIVFATNPPMPTIGSDGLMQDAALGDWLIRWFAPWVDDTYPNPAPEGELRWCFMRASGDRLETVWVAGPGYYDPATGAPWSDATEADVLAGKVAKARSRTFIRALVSDNVFYRESGYAERLSGTPEPLRSMLLLGDFTVKGDDHPMQVIPTQWILAAQERWRNRHPYETKNLRMIVLAGDIAQGGKDTTVLAPLRQTDFYDELITQPGSATPTGDEVEAMILVEREDQAIIVLDGQGGWAGSARDILRRDHKIEAEMFISSAVSGEWTPNSLYKYGNNRAQMWWAFRLALDPKSGLDVCLPPSSRLRAQLATPHFFVQKNQLFVESKDEIRKRLNGASTDEADAVLMAWQYRDQAVARLMSPDYDIVERLNGRAGPEYAKQPIEIEDPRGDW